jgi:molybdenum cofactor cytidylyltransferase
VKTAAVVLAAGSSQRLGELKQLVRLGGETLLERAIRVCGEAGCEPVVVVLGASADAVREGCALGDAVVVLNAEWAEGMGSSVRAGLRALAADAEGCVIMTCDMPAVSADHLRALMVTGGITASAYTRRRGVPAYFPASMFTRLTELHGDAGARELLKEVRAVELVGGELDVDTIADLERAREMFGNAPAKSGT